ncbi:MAG TPA: hypothetical protein VJU61_20815, partial [Polyangiaceae bacterium]|nr:hypothetical protein [Polyangiaceae bacterium]
VRVAIELGFNIMFTSRAAYTPTELPRAGAAADQHCALLAASAGLPGQRWVAWLGAEGPTTAIEDDINPIDRLQHTGGWVRTDGVIVARSAPLLARGALLHGRMLDETGTWRSGDAWVGVASNGRLSGNSTGDAQDCNNWTSVSAEDYGSISHDTGLGFAFAGLSVATCDRASPLLCFGDDSDKQPPIVTPTPNRLAFLSTTTFTPGGGIDAADTICQQEACSAGLTGSGDCSANLGNARTFKSYLNRVGQPAWQRFSPAGPDWVRPDGLLWMRASQLNSDGLGRLTGLNVPLSLNYLMIAVVWVGSTAPLGSCQDWSSTVEEGEFHQPHFDGGRSLAGIASTPCTDSRNLYCLEE